MKRFLYILSTVLSFLGSCFSKTHSLHNARFARLDELTSLVSHTLDEGGLLLGISSFNQILRVRLTKTRPELGNTLIVAPTRGGKGLLAVSQLLTWPHSVVVNDIKGELYDQTAGYRATLGPVFCLDPRGLGHCFDPLHTRTDEDELYAAAKNLLHEPHETDGKPFTERAIKMLTLMWLAARKQNEHSYEQTRLLPFTRNLADLGLNRAVPIIHAISPALATRMFDGEYIPEHDYNENKYLSSSWESLTARLYPLLTEKVARCFNGSDFTGADIITSTKPITIYLCWPESALLAKAPLIRLVWESLIGQMLDTYDRAKGEACHPVLLLLDEAGTVTLPSLPQYVATVAGRGICVWAAIQDLSQLELYGMHKAKTIKNNMDTKIYYRQASSETAEYLERSLGKQSGFAHSQTLHDGQEESQGLSEHAVPLLTARDINELNHDEIIVFFSNHKPFRAKRMDWRAFPILTQRRAIPPPKLATLPELESNPFYLRTKSTWKGRAIDPDDLNPYEKLN
ncbi:MAG: type IV secretory system conjugative DNA transfer family protein [Burkholderiales bacterium]